MVPFITCETCSRKHVCELAFGVNILDLDLGVDFAVTRSSPESCSDRFAIVSEQTVELKWLMFEQAQQVIPLITCEISFG